MTSLNDIRSTFLDYFARHGHAVVESSPLVPRNDPTLLFTNAGMVQFKNVFTGVEKRDYVRAVTSQKCVRAGGKHNDLDNVGYTARHHTFFEMLGNFSFGDYFKEMAIPLAWDLITKEFGLPKDRLLVTIYHDDDEAAEIWRKHAGLSDDRIIRIATSDNFWSMGATGPCGPCSEIFYDHGDHIPGGPPGSPDEDGDRFIEIWNLVFMQFEQIDENRRENLPRPSIDTGMGLERIGAVLQGKHDNYDTDLLRALIEASAQATGADPDGPGRIHHRVIADHLRSSAFLLADGVTPSNEGRGYVLRRIMRRAMRHAHLLGATDPVMHKLVRTLVARMGQAFPELGRARALIEETLRLEEARFRTTLDRGLRLLEDELATLADGAPLPGEAAFRLYDTYGFPLDLTQDALRERGRAVDLAGFEQAMAAQKARARAAWAGSGEASDEEIWFDLREEIGATEFLGYTAETAEGVVRALVADGDRVGSAQAGGSVRLVANQTPFYAESGGQVGDQGEIRTATGRARVTDVRKRAGDLFVHDAEVVEGEIVQGESAIFVVDPTRRSAIRANHSATHLLHEALRAALGEHVAQRGSLVAPDRLRFDFAHGKAMAAAELAAVEAAVNAYIRQNAPVSTRIMTPDEAQALGARALFGEKYGDEVRVVAMGERPAGETGPAGRTYSLELCGGTHVARTGDIGLFKVVAESASSAGVRRVEALTGASALAFVDAQEARLREAAQHLKSAVEDVPERVAALLDERRKLAAEVSDLRRKLALSGGGAEPEARPVGGVPFLAQVLKGVSGKDLRALIDAHKARLGSGAVLLIADSDGKASVAVGVTPDLTARVSAVELARVAAEALGGKGGGGRPDMAQAGGADAAKAPAAIAAAEALLASAV
ncbi:MAG: alanine--tRNA ligase [Rhodobacteraceae bacterium]|nr:MAG: alanine--tRNA ligase [Paracoccaceae bacterium]